MSILHDLANGRILHAVEGKGLTVGTQEKTNMAERLECLQAGLRMQA